MPGQPYRDVLRYLEYMDEALAAGRLGWPEKLPVVRALFDPSRAGHDSLTAEMVLYDFPALWQVRDTLMAEADLRASYDVVLAALTVEQWRIAHGRWPESLADLGPVPTDPFTGAALTYKVDERGVLLYSLGDNGEDDGGNPPPEGYRRPWGGLPPDWDIPFRLLDPELRGATRTYGRDIAASQVTLSQLMQEGIDKDDLKELGLTEDEIDSLDRPGGGSWR